MVTPEDRDRDPPSPVRRLLRTHRRGGRGRQHYIRLCLAVPCPTRSPDAPSLHPASRVRTPSGNASQVGDVRAGAVETSADPAPTALNE